MNWIAYLANHLWQSTLFAGVMWGLAALLKKNRAAVRYGVWMAASVKFLVPFALLVSLGTSLGARWGWKATPRIVAASAAMAMEEIEQPFEVADVTPHVSVVTAQVPGARHQMYVFWELKQYLPQTLLLVWALGFLLGAGLWVRRVWRMRGLRRAGETVEIPGVTIPVLVSRTKMEPCVFGVMRPVLLLPEGIAEQLTTPQMRVVVEHELNHVRRRDNLTAAAHAAVETVFWFWPVVRWMRLRLVEERERACDEAVLRAGGDADVYAESILRVCKFYLASQSQVAAGISGSDLKRRIETILSGMEAVRMSFVKKMALAVVAVMAVGMPVMFGQMRAAPRIAGLVAAVEPMEKVLSPASTPGEETSAGETPAQAAPTPAVPSAGPEQNAVLNWGLLREMDPNAPKAQQPASVLALDGKQMTAVGFMVPLRGQGGKVNDFILASYAALSANSQQPSPNQWIYVKLKGSSTVHPAEPIVVSGKFGVGQVKSPYGGVSLTITDATEGSALPMLLKDHSENTDAKLVIQAVGQPFPSEEAKGAWLKLEEIARAQAGNAGAAKTPATNAAAKGGADLSGTWQGVLNNGNNLRMVFKMTNGDGGWQTGMFSIDEGPNAHSTGLTTLHDADSEICHSG